MGAALPNALEEGFEGFVVRSLVFNQDHELSLAYPQYQALFADVLALESYRRGLREQVAGGPA